MNPLQSRLGALRRRLRFVVLWRGLTGVVALLLACGIFAGIVDWAFHLPSLVRGILLVGTLTATAYVAYVFLVLPLAARADDLSLALKVEEHYPILNDSLASTVQFLSEPAKVETAGSPAMRREAVQRALRMAQGCNFNDVVDSRGTWWTGCGALASATVVLTLLVLFPGLSATAFCRFVEPFGSHSWTHLAVEGCPHRVALGSPYVIKGQVTGIIPAEARIEVESRAPDEPETIAKPDRLAVPVKRDAEAATGKFETALDMTQQRTKFRFRIRAYDAVYPPHGWHEVEVVPPPQLAMLDGLPSPQIELQYPAYTDLPSPEKLSPGVQHLDIVAGTLVNMRAAVDRPIVKAWIEYRPDQPHAKTTLALGPIGLGGLGGLQAYAGIAGGHAVWGNIPARITEDGLRLSVDFMPWVNGLYVLHLADEEGLSRSYEWRVKVFADPLPAVTVERPGSNLDVLEDAEISLKAFAVDEKYAVRSVYLEYRKHDADGKWLDSGPGQIPLYQHDRKKAKEQRVSVSRRWSIKGLGKEGQVLVVQVCADDFNDVVAYRQPGRSHEIELRIVSKKELAKKVEEGLQEIQKEVVRVRQMQAEALEKVREIQDKIRDKKDQPGPRRSQELIEVEEKQKQIQARISANQEEGLRAELKRMKEMLKDNKMPSTDAGDRLKFLESELERITQQDLQHIEPNLMEARKESGEAKRPAESKETKGKEDTGKESKQSKGKEDAGKESKAQPGKNEKPKQKQGAKENPLDKAQRHQESAKKALDELVRYMAPWADMQQVKGEARKIEEKQRDIKKATEAAADKQRALQQEKTDLEKNQKEIDAKLETNPGDPKLRAEKKKLAARTKQIEQAQEDVDKEFGKLAEVQGDLSEQAKNLLKTIDGVQKKQAEKGENKAAGLLKEARDIAEKGMLPEKMRDAKEHLDEQKPNLAKALQKESIENLDKVISTLEERREDQIAKLMKGQRKEEDKLEKFRQDQDILQKKARQEKKAVDELTKKKKDIEDKLDKKRGNAEKLKAEKDAVDKELKEHKRMLERLAEEERKLQKKLEKEARELARLQAGDAGKELDRAAEMLERAADQMENGDDPDEALQEAMDRIENAQDKLEDAQDELAREQLARIADQIKALKERQDRAITDTVRLHREAIEKTKHWTDTFLKTLKANARAQKAIGLETDSLKDKLKGAKVFEHVLVRAAKAMDEAAKSMEKRWETGNLRQDALEREEIVAEMKAQEETLRWQNEAGRKLTRLLDSIKNEEVARRPPRKQEKKENKGKEKEDEQQGMAPGDGIPDVAQLKVLRDEQRDLLERTKDFAKRHPAWPKVDEGERERMAEIQTEFNDIQTEQSAIQRLFEEITARPEGKEENP